MSLQTNEANGALIQTSQPGQVGVVTREAAELRGQIVLAREFPRDEETCFARLLQSCERPRFADGCLYSFPRGNATVSGPGVKLAREAARIWGNIRYALTELADEDPDYAHLRGQAIDLQTNTLVAMEDRFRKAIQRRDKSGETHWMPCRDERDLRELKNRRGAILIRNCLLQLLPPDLIDEAVGQVGKTEAKVAKGDIKQDRAGVVRALVKAFLEIGVRREHLEDHLGGPLDAITPEQLVDLRGIYRAIEDGAKQARDVFDLTPARPNQASPTATELRQRVQKGKQPPQEPPARDEEPPPPPDPSEPDEPAGPATAPQEPAASPNTGTADPYPGPNTGTAVDPYAGMSKAELLEACEEAETRIDPSLRDMARDTAGIEDPKNARKDDLIAYLHTLVGSDGQEALSF